MKSDYTITMKHIINENIKRYVPHALNVGINLQNIELLCVTYSETRYIYAYTERSLLLDINIEKTNHFFYCQRTNETCKTLFSQLKYNSSCAVYLV